MDGFLGKWKAGEQDFTGTDDYAKATGQTQLIDTISQGYETEVTKSGDYWVFDNCIAGQPAGKDFVDLSGKYKVEMPGGQSVDAEATVKFQDGKLCIEGTMGGQKFKTIRYIQGGRYIVETHSDSAKMTCSMSKA